MTRLHSTSPSFHHGLLCCVLALGGGGCTSSPEDSPTPAADTPAGTESTVTGTEPEEQPTPEPEEAESSPRAEVVEVHGNVRLNAKPLKKGKVVLTGEIVVGKGRAVIEIPGAGTLRVFPNTRTSVGKTRSRFRVRLALGKVWAMVTQLDADTRFEVETANAVAGVRGTEYVVEAKQDETDVRVVEGEVRVANEEGEDQAVKARQRSSVKGRSRPTKPRPYNPSIDKAIWDKAKGIQRDVTRGVRSIEKTIGKKINKFLP